MRGHRMLKGSGSLERIAEVKQALTLSELRACEGRASRLIFGVCIADTERAVRQYLLTRVAGLDLNRSLLYALGRPGTAVIHPLPATWRCVLREHGFAVADLRCSIAWVGFVGMFLAYGVLSIVRHLIDGITERGRGRYQGLGRYAYFGALTEANLPRRGDDGPSHDILTWYALWPERETQVDTLCHSVARASDREAGAVKVKSVPGPVRPITHPRALARFLAWGLAATLVAVAEAVRGRWWHALMLSEAASASVVRTHESNALAAEYLFHNSGWIYRPLWTYEAEQRGSAVTFYFYSTNCEPFKREHGYPPTPYGWAAMSWPRYLVWNEGQADFVRRAVGDSVAILVVGPIWFSCSAASLPQLAPGTIAVFDVQPVRNGFYEALGLEFDYYVPGVANPFFRDIYDAARGAGRALAVKRKREIGKLAHPRYRRYMREFERLPGVVAIDPGISALRLIEHCDAVISMPFTSTALLGKELAKPSVYYDPAGVLDKADRAAHGIEILSSPEELRQWLLGALRN